MAIAVDVIDDPVLPFTEDNMIIYDGTSSCPHLRGERGSYSCAVHDKPWYKETVCFRYNKEEPDCILGYYYMKQEDEKMATRGAAEYEDYLRQCKAKNEEPKVFICSKCDHPLKTKDSKCPQCNPK